ncbi:MAG: methionine synthase [Candidatus Marinimicrobia bacterium]|nr:methionine synthase [Candidatus Neomarinimicrobiota bacterium]
MIAENQIYQINPKDLLISRDEIYRTMGYPSLPEEQIVNDLEILLVESFEYMEIKTGFSFFHQDRLEIKDQSFYLNGEKFDCGKIIYNHIKKSENMIIFLATLGNPFDDFIKSFFDWGDPYKGYLADTIGSVVVESAIDRMCEQVSNLLNQQGKKCTNRFSPGYCNWNITEQQKLFRQLPDHFLGVELLPSSLMKPIKSVSGIIGVGQEVQKMPYTCNLCNQQNCIMRREKFKEKQ